jgi:predicted dehydrogenase
MQEIKWGIVGTGNIASSFATDFKYTSGGSMIAVASRSAEKAKQFCKEYGIERPYGSYEALFQDKDVDAVYIATPHHLHFQNASDALLAGKAVLCEKPLTVNARDCQKLMDIAKTSNKYLMEAMWTYFLPPIQKATQWLEQGRIGSIKNIKADFAFKAPEDPYGRLYNPELAGGALLDIGIYPIALTWLILKQVPEKMSVFSRKAQTGVDVEETMIFEYPNGILANLTASFAYRTPAEAVIAGTDGYIKIPDFFMAKECSLFHDDQLVDKFVDDREAVGYNYEIDAVHQDLMHGKKASSIVPPDFSLKLQEMMDQVKGRF